MYFLCVVVIVVVVAAACSIFIEFGVENVLDSVSYKCELRFVCGLTELAELKERESLTLLEMFKIFLNYEIKLNFFFYYVCLLLSTSVFKNMRTKYARIFLAAYCVLNGLISSKEVKNVESGLESGKR